MRTLQQQRNYEMLEQLPPESRQSAGFKQRLLWFWQDWLEFWYLAPGEPQVQKKRSRIGEVYWQVYDPLKDYTVCFDDEQRLLEWLETAQHRKARPNPWELDW